MCLICVDFKNGGLTVNEARNNMVEMMDELTDDHLEEIEEMLLEAQEDAYWEDENFCGIDSIPMGEEDEDMSPEERQEFWRKFNKQWDEDDHEDFQSF